MDIIIIAIMVATDRQTTAAAPETCGEKLTIHAHISQLFNRVVGWMAVIENYESTVWQSYLRRAKRADV